MTKKHLFFVFFGHFLGHFSDSTSINDSLTIELNYLLNWISRFFFELNNILNQILVKAILNESCFGKIETLNWIREGIKHPYSRWSWLAPWAILTTALKLVFFSSFDSNSHCWLQSESANIKLQILNNLFWLNHDSGTWETTSAII